MTAAGRAYSHALSLLHDRAAQCPRGTDARAVSGAGNGSSAQARSHTRVRRVRILRSRYPVRSTAGEPAPHALPALPGRALTLQTGTSVGAIRRLVCGARLRAFPWV